MKTLICAASVVLTLVATASSEAAPAEPTSIPVHNLTINSLTTDALNTLAERYHVVIGVSGTFTGTDSLWIHVTLKDGTLGEVFDAIVRADPRFKWKTATNGAVHFVREAPLPLLDIAVHSFDAEDFRRRDVSSTLPQIPEVAGWLKDHRCIMTEILSGSSLPEEWRRFAVHAKGTPFSAVLDEIAAKSGTYFWAVVQHTTDGCVIHIVP